MSVEHLTSEQWATRRTFERDVHAETASARARWTDGGTADEWGMVLVEEVGKFARCINKLHIAEDDDVRDRWLEEGYHRLVTMASVIERLAHRWPEQGRALGRRTQ